MDDHKPNQTCNQRGQSLLEMALLTPFLIILVLSVLETGMLYLVSINIRDAVQEAAAYASVCPSDNAAIRNRLRESSTYPGDLSSVPDGDITICVMDAGSTVCGGTPEFGDSISVSLSYNYQVMTPLLAIIAGTNMNLPLEAERIIVSTACP